jgi:hypothetical protein
VKGFPPPAAASNLGGIYAAGMSIADDPLFRGLPQASRDRIEVAESLREEIIRHGDATAQDIAEADWSVFQVATEQLWKSLKPDVEAFEALLPKVGRLVYGPSSKVSERVMRDLRRRALLDRARSEEADSRNAAQSRRNKAAAARSRSPSADELRRMICEMKKQRYKHQKMCRRLDAAHIPTPEHANWGGRTWSSAYMDPKYGPRVKKYLSNVAYEASA